VGNEFSSDRAEVRLEVGSGVWVVDSYSAFAACGLATLPPGVVEVASAGPSEFALDVEVGPATLVFHCSANSTQDAEAFVSATPYDLQDNVP
jgi:hypothetical protein